MRAEELGGQQKGYSRGVVDGVASHHPLLQAMPTFSY